MRDLPIGVADFAEIRQDDFYYADKTQLLYELVKFPEPYFLSRPRRFGKSLLVSALGAILSGKRELFKGLWIDSSDYDWKKHPVIKLVMSSVDSRSSEMTEDCLFAMLRSIAKEQGVSIEGPSPGLMFKSLISALYEKHGQKQKVAILIDEYDTPILDQINQPKLADEIRKILSKFYAALKTVEDIRGHVFITGVTRFTKASIFSALNNLKDLTFEPAFADICGINRAEFKALFAERQEPLLKALKADGCLPPEAAKKDLKKLIFDWYDGYSWDGKTKVLNPWSLLSFFQKGRISDYWHETGNPTFLKELLNERRASFDLSQKFPPVTESSNAVSDVANLDPAVLMFQTGYLTVKRVEKAGIWKYHLGLPNLEVKAAFVPLLLSIESPKNPVLAKKLSVKARDALFVKDAAGFEEAFGGYLNQFPYSVHQPNEAYYHALLISAMMLADQTTQNEGQTGEGRYDMLLRKPKGGDFIIELKYLKVEAEAEGGGDSAASGTNKGSKKKSSTVVRREMAELARKAMRQIEEKYQSGFAGGGRPVCKVAVVVAGRTKVLAEFEEAQKRRP